MQPRRAKLVYAVAALFVACTVAGTSWFGYSQGVKGQVAAAYRTQQEADNVYVRFDMEAFDTISAQYWKTVQASDLAELYRLSLAKVVGADVTLPSQDRIGVAAALAHAFAGKSDAEQHDMALSVLQVVLYNLAPTGRDQLMTSQQEQSFRQDVANIHPTQNLYADLGLPNGASTSSVEQAFKQKSDALKQATSSVEKQQLADAQHAHAVLANATDKQLYDQTGMQPSVSMQVMGGHTLYVDLSKVTPASFTEFVHEITANAQRSAVTGMILDLRGNVGGTFDFLQNFLALFIGPNQYAFDIYRKDEYLPQRTAAVEKLAELSQFKDIVILTDNMTQSTAELTTAVFKRYHLAQVVGSTTRGWGSVENTYPLKTTIDTTSTYALLLVNSLTLDENNQPIESNGVKPDIDISQSGWQARVRDTFPTSMAQAVVDVLAPHTN